jgi:amino acid transporter
MNAPTSNIAKPSLRKVMRGKEYFTLAFGSIVGVGWLQLINDWLDKGGPVGAMLAFLIGGVALVPVALVYGKLARRMPEAGSEVAYTAAVFPRSISFAAGWVVTLAYLVVGPYEAVAIGQLAAYVFPDMNSIELYRIGDKEVFLPHLVVGIGLTLVITILNYRGMSFSAGFQNWTTFGLLAVFCVFAPLGLWRGNVDNMQPFFAKGTDARDALRSMLAVLPIVPYFMMGFETIPKCSEEAANDFDSRRFNGLILLALGVAIFFYVTVIAVVALLVPWQDLSVNKLEEEGINFPRRRAGATSEMYIGAKTLAAPMASPPSSRPAMKTPAEPAAPVMSALNKKRAAVSSMVGRRPTKSATVPARKAPTAQPSSTEATANPVPAAWVPKAPARASTAPLMTPLSKPKRKPPTAATEDNAMT